MLQTLLQRPRCKDVEYLETTITDSNAASWALFQNLAKRMGADPEISVAFDQEKHFHGQHETEHLLRVGPFSHPNLAWRCN